MNNVTGPGHYILELIAMLFLLQLYESMGLGKGIR